MTSYEAHFFVTAASEKRDVCGDAGLFDKMMAAYLSALECQRCGANPEGVLETEALRIREMGIIRTGKLEAARRIAADIMKLGENYPVSNDLDRARGLYEKTNRIELGA